MTAAAASALTALTSLKMTLTSSSCMERVLLHSASWLAPLSGCLMLDITLGGPAWEPMILPDMSALTAMQRLQHMKLSSLPWAALPAWLGELQQLTSLALNTREWCSSPVAANQRAAPVSLAARSPLAHLTRLRHCQLSHLALASCGTPGVLDITSLTALTYLQLRKCSLAGAVPAGVLPTMARLQQLNLSGNTLEDLPEDVTALRQLRDLDLHHNPLASLPLSALALPHLTQLWAVPGIPPPGVQLRAAGPVEAPALQRLTLHCREFPLGLLQLQALSYLTLHVDSPIMPAGLLSLPSLSIVRVGCSSATSWDTDWLQLAPSSAGTEAGGEGGGGSGAGAGAALEEVALTGMRLARVPPELLQAHRLRSLSLIGCGLRHLPAHIWSLPLERLQVVANQLQELPEVPEAGGGRQLSSLSVAGNELQCLPQSLGLLQALTCLDVQLNHLQVWLQCFKPPGVEVVAQGSLLA